MLPISPLFPSTPSVHQSQAATVPPLLLRGSHPFVSSTNAALSSQLSPDSRLFSHWGSEHSGPAGVQVSSAGRQLRSAVFTLDGSLRPAREVELGCRGAGVSVVMAFFLLLFTSHHSLSPIQQIHFSFLRMLLLVPVSTFLHSR